MNAIVHKTCLCEMGFLTQGNDSQARERVCQGCENREGPERHVAYSLKVTTHRRFVYKVYKTRSKNINRVYSISVHSYSPFMRQSFIRYFICY
jgi:hypothetical protein